MGGGLDSAETTEAGLGREMCDLGVSKINGGNMY